MTQANDPADNQPFYHRSVLWDEVLTGLRLQPRGHYLDVTLGGGGHSYGILEGAAESHVWGVDQDPSALAAATERLRVYGDRFHPWRGNFRRFNPGHQRFHGIVADLGVSSAQLDHGDRGFSFRQDAPLDMRMDPDHPLTAATIVNHWSEQELSTLFWDYGEERFSRRIARAIVQSRPLHTTQALGDVIRRSVPGKYRQGRLHPATRVFQALRIAVNEELSALTDLLSLAPQWLHPGGRLVVISFHSLEDRQVKYAFRNAPDLQIITKKPLVATPEEIQGNPRSRSAKLRIAEKISECGQSKPDRWANV